MKSSISSPESASRQVNGVSRRSVVAASAWSVPAIALAVAAPAAAGSGQPLEPCPYFVSAGTSWQDGSANASFQPWTTGNRWGTLDYGPQAYGFLSSRDNYRANLESTFSILVTFVADPARTYTFVYQVAGKHAPATERTTGQRLDLKINGVIQKTWSTDGNHGQQLNMWSGTTLVTPNGGTFTIGPGVSGVQTIEYFFTLRPIPLTPGVGWADGRYANDDIWVSALALTACTP